jgi:hypothetical protein
MVPMLLVVLLSGTGFILAKTQPGMTIPWDYPRLDTIYMVLAYPRTYAMEKARACEIDNFIGAIVADDVRELTEDYGWSISANTGFHMCNLGVNCRVTCPDSAGAWWDYHGRTVGFPLYPLELSQFRMALEIIVSGFKTAWIASIYEFINVRIDQVVPPANEYWFNPCITEYESDWAVAEAMLVGAGFTWDIGPDATPHTTDDTWMMPNGDWLWNPNLTWGGKFHSERYAGYCSAPGEDTYGIFVICPGPGLATTSYQISMLHASKWNEFFCGSNTCVGCTAESPLLFLDDYQDTYDPLIIMPFYDRDYDIYMLCWGLGRNPDYLYDFFHPDVDLFGGDNSPGLVHDGLDRLLATIKFWTLADYEVLASNVGPPCDETSTVVAGTTYGPIGPFDASGQAVQLVVERCDLALGVYDEPLEEDVDYSVSWFTLSGLPGYYCSITLLHPVVLELGDALEALFPAGSYSRLLTTTEEMRNLVYLAQWKLYYLVPYLPIYSRNYINLYKPGVTCWVNSRGYGSEPTAWHWTLGSLHWVGTPIGGTLNWQNAGGMSTLNPITASWVYEFNVLNGVYEGLTTIDPYTHADLPWVACRWEIIPWVDEGLGIDNGMIIKFWLRDDVYWQNGDHVTADDIAWNYEFIKSITAAELQPIWSTLDHYEVINEYQIDLYVNVAGYWKFLEMAGAALFFPEKIWAPFMGDYDDSTIDDYNAAIAFETWNTLYSDYTGEPDPIAGPVELTCCYGTGPFIFEWWDTTVGLGLVKLTKHYDYWMKLTAYPNAQLPQIAVPGSFYKDLGNGTIIPYGSTSYIYITIQNVNTKEPCEPDWVLKKDGVAIASGTVSSIDPCDYITIVVKGLGNHLGPGTNLYTLEVTNADGTTTYALTIAWVVGDGNMDYVTDMADIDNLITLFLVETGQPGWNPAFDFNGDGVIDMADIDLAITHFLEEL